MLELLFALSLTLSPSAPVQSAEELETARTALTTAFKQGEAEDRVAAIGSYGRVADPVVVDWVSKGLGDKTPAVRDAALDALRWSTYPTALEELESFYKREKKLRKDPEFGPQLVRAIAQHGNAKSIGLLAKDALSDREPKLSNARILGLGHIRDPKSVEALMGLMKKAGRNRTQPYMDDFRMSLMVLTGTDNGKSQEAWIAWWNDNKKGLVVTPVAPELPKKMQYKWNRYWGIESKADRGRRREDRGGGEG
jgi:hypothetical protein